MLRKIIDTKLMEEDKRIRNFLLLGGAFYVLPIILANRYYNDDLSRTLYAYAGWTQDGRPLSQLILYFVSGWKPLADISPLNLLMGVVLLVMSLTIYARKNLSFIANKTCVAMALLMVLVQPFDLQSISYKYESLFMLLALSIPFLLFSTNEDVSLWIKLGVSVITGVMIMSIYQAVLGMFLILELVQMYLCMQIQRKSFKDYFKAELPRLAGVMAGALFYVVAIAPRFVDKKGWRHEASQVSLGLNGRAVANFFENIKRGLAYQLQVLHGTSKLYIVSLLLLCTLTVIAIVMQCWKNHRKEEHNASVWLMDVLLVLLPLAAVICVYLPMTVLSSMALKYRVFFCFGGVLLLLALMIMGAFGNKCKILMVVMGACLFFQYSSVYAYGNALKCQKEYEEYTVHSLAHDLETLNAEGDYQKVSYLGNAPKAKQLQTICEKYPFFDEIVPVYVTNDTWIGGVWVNHYLQDELEICEPDDSDITVAENETPVLKNALYECYTTGDKIIVSWK